MRLLIEAPRWFFLGILIWAPWAFGSTRPWTIGVLNVLLAACFGLWLLSCVARRSWPYIAWPCPALAGLLLLQALWMFFNASALVNESGKLALVKNPWPQLPGSVEQQLTREACYRFAGLLGGILFVADLSRREVWRRRLWLTLALTGTSIVLLGLVERVARAPMIFWETDRTSPTFFATFFYHANAGAFINLVLPLIAGLAIVAKVKRQQVPLALWSAAALIVLAGAFVNFSRGAQATTVLLLLLIATWQTWESFSRRRWKSAKTALGVAVVVIALVPIALLGWTSSATRWTAFSQDLSTNGRLFANRVSLRMAADAGTLGFGPGTFRVVFPFYVHESEEPEAGGFWRYAHQDYLQTYAEWGWFGSLGWAGLFGGGLLAGLYRGFNSTRRLARPDQVLLATSSLALIGVALHALVDFPLQIASLQLYTSVYLGLGWGALYWASADSASA